MIDITAKGLARKLIQDIESTDVKGRRVAEYESFKVATGGQEESPGSHPLPRGAQDAQGGGL